MDQDKVTTVSSNRKAEVPSRKLFLYKLAKQISLVGVWISLGLLLEIIGPTLPDLKDLVGVNYEEISRALVAKSAGLFVGAFIGGILHERFYSHTDMIMSLGILVGSLGITCIPFIPMLGFTSFLLFLTGVSEGVINTGGNTMVLHMWGDNAASPMHSLHFGFAVGAMLSPQLAKPFLSSDIAPEGDLNLTTGLNLTMLPNSTASVLLRTPSHLEYPYSTVGIIGAVFAIIMMVFQFIPKPEGYPKRENRRNMASLFQPSTCAFGSTMYGVQVLALLFLFFSQAVGGERACGKFLFSFAIESELAFSKGSAAHLNTVFWICHMSGRALGTLLSKFLPIHILIFGDITIGCITTTLLVFLGYKVSMALWVLSALLGALISILFPSGMSWGNLHLQMNSMTVMMAMMGGSVGGFVYHYLSGYLFEYYGPRSFLYVMLGYSLCTLCIYCIMEFVVRRKGAAIIRDWKVGQVKDALTSVSPDEKLLHKTTSEL